MNDEIVAVGSADNPDTAFEPALARRVFATVATRRRSVRGFTRTPVPESTLHEIFTLAQSAPSNCNTQPWRVYVVGGERCERLRAQLVALAASETFTPDIPYNGNYAGVYRERQHDAAAQLYGAMGIVRGDRERRGAAFMRNYAFYDAPHVAFLCLPEFGGVREAADLGLYAQTLMLTLAAYGIGSCAQTALGLYARPIKQALDIPAQQQLLFGISFGYEQPEFAANRARVGRAPLAETTQFLF